LRVIHISGLLAVSVASAGCNSILGIDDRPVGPPRDAGASTFESDSWSPIDGVPAPSDAPGATANAEDAAPREGGNASTGAFGADSPGGSVAAAPDGASPAPDVTTSTSDAATAMPDDTSTTPADGSVSGVNGGIDASDSAAATDGPPTDSGPTATSYASCLAILKAAPTSSSGTYVIFPGGTSLAVHCDMDFAGGGWTLVQSTNGGSCTPVTETAGPVALGSCTYMPSAAVTALAQGSTTVHVRTASGSAAPVAYITSATAVPIQNLRMGLVTNANEPVGDAVTEEAAWTVVGDPGNANKQGRTPQSILAFTCAVTGEMWPAVYHACGNGADGFVLEVLDNVSFWNWGVMPHVNIAMEVYVR